MAKSPPRRRGKSAARPRRARSKPTTATRPRRSAGRRSGRTSAKLRQTSRARRKTTTARRRAAQKKSTAKRRAPRRTARSRRATSQRKAGGGVRRAAATRTSTTKTRRKTTKPRKQSQPAGLAALTAAKGRRSRHRKAPTLDRQRRSLRGDEIVTPPTPPPAPAPPVPIQPPPMPEPLHGVFEGVTNGEVDAAWALDHREDDLSADDRSDDSAQALGVESRHADFGPEREEPVNDEEPHAVWNQGPSLEDLPDWAKDEEE